MSSTFRVLHIGFTPESAAAKMPGVDLPKLSKELESSLGAINADERMKLDNCWLHFEDAVPAARVEAHLKQSPFYDAIVIGGGLRLPPENTVIFEGVMDGIRRFASPASRVVFTMSPTGHLDALKRGLGL